MADEVLGKFPREDLIAKLSRCPKTTSELAEIFGASRKSVGGVLGQLSRKKVVRNTSKGWVLAKGPTRRKTKRRSEPAVVNDYPSFFTIIELGGNGRETDRRKGLLVGPGLILMLPRS